MVNGRVPLPFLDRGQTSQMSSGVNTKEDCPMVTYEALFTYMLVIIGIINLILHIKKK